MISSSSGDSHAIVWHARISGWLRALAGSLTVHHRVPDQALRVATATRGKPLVSAVTALQTSHRRWAAARKRAAEDRKFWKLALRDQRVMADIDINATRCDP